MRMAGIRYDGGLTFARLRESVARDRFSDFLPLVAWDAKEEAFLCIDDGFGYAWDLVPSAYMFTHVHQALLGLLNVHFAPGTVLQLHSFADPVIEPVLDAFLDIKTRPDPLIQASARRTHAYLNDGRDGLDALHGIPVRDFRTFLAVKARQPMHSDLRRQIEEQLAKLGIRRVEAILARNGGNVIVTAIGRRQHGAADELISFDAFDFRFCRLRHCDSETCNSQS